MELLCGLARVLFHPAFLPILHHHAPHLSLCVIASFFCQASRHIPAPCSFTHTFPHTWTFASSLSAAFIVLIISFKAQFKSQLLLMLITSFERHQKKKKIGEWLDGGRESEREMKSQVIKEFSRKFI